MVGKSNVSRDQQADLQPDQQHRDSPQADRISPEVNQSTPSDSIEQKQRFYGQLWQHYNQGLRASLYPFERDVAVVQKAMGERGLKETQFIIVRGSEAQSYLRVGNREGAFAYVDRVVATAQENQLSPEQRDRARFVAKTIDQLLNRVGKDEYEGPSYKTQRDFATQTLKLEAKDGRGVVLQRKQGAISRSNLSQQDEKFFQEIDRKLQVRQTSTQPSISKSPQYEIGD